MKKQQLYAKPFQAGGMILVHATSLASQSDCMKLFVYIMDAFNIKKAGGPFPAPLYLWGRDVWIRRQGMEMLCDQQFTTLVACGIKLDRLARRLHHWHAELDSFLVQRELR